MHKNYSDICDECEVNTVSRIETNPDNANDQKGYCIECQNANGEQCEECGDVFVNFGWHVRDNTKNGGIRP